MVLLVVVVAAAFVALRSPWLEALGEPGARAHSDFQILWAAGQAQAEGQDGYDPAVLDTFGARAGRRPTPFCAAPPLVVGSFGLLPGDNFQRDYGTWLVVSLVGVVVACLLLGRVLALSGLGGLTALAVAVGALALGEGTWMSLAMNSTNALALVTIVGALLAAQRGHQVLEGVLLALATVAKTSPALLVLVAVLAGRRRTALAAAGALLVAGLLSVAWLGWASHDSWIENVLPALGYAPELEAGRFDNSLHAWNLAPNGLLSRELLRSDLPRTAAWAASWLVTILVLVHVASSLRASRDGSPRGVLRQYALGVSASFLVSSVTWPHHLLLAAVPGAWLVADRLVARRVDAALVLGAVALVVLALPLGTLSSDEQQRLDIAAKSAACVVLLAVVTAGVRPAKPAPEPDG